MKEIQVSGDRLSFLIIIEVSDAANAKSIFMIFIKYQIIMWVQPVAQSLRNAGRHINTIFSDSYLDDGSLKEIQKCWQESVFSNVQAVNSKVIEWV